MDVDITHYNEIIKQYSLYDLQDELLERIQVHFTGLAQKILRLTEENTFIAVRDCVVISTAIK